MTHSELQTILRKELETSEPAFRVDLTAIRDAGRRRRSRRRLNFALVSAILIGASSIAFRPLSQGSTRPEPSTTVHATKTSDLIAKPNKAEPGQSIALTFSPDTTRGLGFTLTNSQGIIYGLTSDRTGATPTWVVGPPSEIDIGIIGAGPDHVVIPDVATPGPYKLCADGSTILCVTISVS